MPAYTRIVHSIACKNGSKLSLDQDTDPGSPSAVTTRFGARSPNSDATSRGHCGGGKKYKKCCYGKDQALLRDASQYAGTTRSELKSRPGLVDDPAVIYDMRPYELKRLEPSELGENQLLTGYHCALQYGLRELAFDMLVECEGRPSAREFDPGHFEDRIERVLEAGDLDLARKIRDH